MKLLAVTEHFSCCQRISTYKFRANEATLPELRHSLSRSSSLRTIFTHQSIWSFDLILSHISNLYLCKVATLELLDGTSGRKRIYYHKRTENNSLHHPVVVWHHKWYSVGRKFPAIVWQLRHIFRLCWLVFRQACEQSKNAA